MTITLPPLPETNTVPRDYYTVEQMQAYATAAIQEDRSKYEAVLQRCVEAMNIGRDAAYNEAQQYHEQMKGYRPARHQSMDDDVARIDAAITDARSLLDGGKL